MATGKLFLLPITLGDNNPNEVIPSTVLMTITGLRHFIVENIRTTRRFLRKIDPTFPIDDSVFFELNQHTKPNEIDRFLLPTLNGKDVGIMSEAGVPGIADPGADVVSLAHKKGIRVVPLVGPSSILLGMMAAGLNGQSFAFNGYLPIKSDERAKKIKHFEQRSVTEKQAQMFIETPYRNMPLFSDLLKTCLPQTQLTIAADITLETEYIKTQTIEKWQKSNIDLSKRPAVFVIQG